MRSWGTIPPGRLRLCQWWQSRQTICGRGCHLQVGTVAILVALCSRNARLMLLWVMGATASSRPDLADYAPSAPHPQNFHRISTAGAQPWPVVHIMWTPPSTARLYGVAP